MSTYYKYLITLKTECGLVATKEKQIFLHYIWIDMYDYLKTSYQIVEPIKKISINKVSSIIESNNSQ
jgi:hypothetical protein